MEYAVEIKNLSKEYETGFLKKKRVRALDDLTLNVAPGQIFGFLGGNGAGKTTTIKTLMRLQFPTEGSAKILGHDISDVSMHARIGYCPENPYFYDYLTAREVMDYLGELFGMDKLEAFDANRGTFDRRRSRRTRLEKAAQKIFKRNAPTRRARSIADK
ncbi:MAG: ABC transporter ATP-binding protein [Acidobacteria bacterium]|nr:ABC transporter ATP-binding protein [Acidobacteriota bacterium]